MSTEALTWVLQHACGVDEDGNLADVPAHTMAVLLGLANHAHADGTAAWPRQATLARYARKSERAVRKDLAELKKLKIIERGDQRLVEHIAADERPVVYDLQMQRFRPGRNPSTYPQKPRGGTTVPAPAGQQVPPADDRTEPDDRPEPPFRPVPDGRSHGSGPEQTGRNHSSAPDPRDRNHSSEGTGTTVPPNRPGTKTSSSSSGTNSPSSLVDRHARAIGVIRRHLPDLDDDDEAAAVFCEWLRVTYRVQPALLGAYVSRMALSGDLAGAYAEHRAGATPAPAARPASLISLGQHDAERAQRTTQRARALSGEPVHTAAALVRAEMRPTRNTRGPTARSSEVA